MKSTFILESEGRCSCLTLPLVSPFQHFSPHFLSPESLLIFSARCLAELASEFFNSLETPQNQINKLMLLSGYLSGNSEDFSWDILCGKKETWYNLDKEDNQGPSQKTNTKSCVQNSQNDFFFKQDPSILWDAWGKTMFYFRRENMNFSVNLNAVKDIYHNWSQTTIAWIRNF